jgi:hypothetical protein
LCRPEFEPPRGGFVGWRRRSLSVRRKKIPSSTPHLREKVFFLNTMSGAVLPRGSSIDFLDQELLKNPFISLLIDDRNRDFYIKNPFNNLFNQVSIYNHHLFLDFLLSKNESENESLDDS